MDKTTTTCPTCRSQVPYHKGYVTWCECGWNLDHPVEWQEKGTLVKWYQRVKDIQEKILANPFVRLPLRKASSVTVALTIFATMSLLFYIVAGIALLKLHSTLATMIGILLLAGLILPVQAAWKFPRATNARSMTRDQAPLTFEQLDLLVSTFKVAPIARIDLVPGNFHIRVVQPWLRHCAVLQVSLPLLYELDDELLLLGILREQHLQQEWHHSLVASGQWTQMVLDTAHEIILNETHAERLAISDEPEHEENLHDDYYAVVRHARRRSTIRSFRLLAIPFALIPKRLATLQAQQLTLFIHRSVYEVNARIARQVGCSHLLRYFEVLSLAEPIAYALQEITEEGMWDHREEVVRNKRKELPDREKLRLLYTAPEEHLTRPLIDWQVKCIEAMAMMDTTFSANRNPSQPHSSFNFPPTTQLIAELTHLAAHSKARK